MEEDKKSTAICRVCLRYDFQKEESVSLFVEYNAWVISDKINALANVGIKEGDGLPNRICPECLLELENAFKFKLKCEKTNEILLAPEAPSFESNDGALNENYLLNMKEEYLDGDDDDDADNVKLDDHITLGGIKTSRSSSLEIEGNDGALNDNYLLFMKEEYLDDDDADNVKLDDHISLCDINASRSSSLETEQPVAAPTKLSRAINLKLICHDCGESFKSKCKLRVHWKKVHLSEYLKCKSCLRKFKSFAALISHEKQNLKSCLAASKVRIEGDGKNRIFHCKECEYHSKRIKDVSAHIVVHSGERPFQCEICLKNFTQLSSVNTHKENAHKLYKHEGTCQHCGKHFKSRSKLFKHLRTHKTSSPDGYPCKVCEAVLKTKNSLYIHMKRHSGVKAYLCDVCSASFYSPSALWCHKEKVHIKSQKFSCNICKYTNLSKYCIKKHMLKHTASNFGCNVCGMLFESEYQLELHHKRHTDRNYACPYCDKRYYSKKNKLAHIRHKHRSHGVIKYDTSSKQKLKVNLSSKS